MGGWVGTGVFRGDSGVSVGASVGVGVPVAAAAVGGAVGFPSDSESPHAVIAKAKAHIRERHTVQVKPRMSNLKLVKQLTFD